MAKPTIRVLMSATAKGAIDSTTIREFEAGREYELYEELAEAFFSMGVADPAEAREPASEPETGENSEGTDTAPAPAKPATRKRSPAAKVSE